MNDWGKAAIILDQLGGFGRLQAMVAATHFSYKAEGELSFQFKGSRKTNLVKVVLNASDLYDITFYRYNKTTYGVAETKRYSDIYAEDMKGLIEEYTGLYLSL